MVGKVLWDLLSKKFLLGFVCSVFPPLGQLYLDEDFILVTKRMR